jgi:hypothetical protein
MREMVDKLLDINPETRPDAISLLLVDQIYQEAVKIQAKVAEADQ